MKELDRVKAFLLREHRIEDLATCCELKRKRYARDLKLYARIRQAVEKAGQP